MQGNAIPVSGFTKGEAGLIRDHSRIAIEGLHAVTLPFLAHSSALTKRPSHHPGLWPYVAILNPCGFGSATSWLFRVSLVAMAACKSVWRQVLLRQIEGFR